MLPLCTSRYESIADFFLTIFDDVSFQAIFNRTAFSLYFIFDFDMRKRQQRNYDSKKQRLILFLLHFLWLIYQKLKRHCEKFPELCKKLLCFSMFYDFNLKNLNI